MLADEMIRDQLEEKTNIPRVRERLLLESELSLGKAMIIANQIEAALSDIDMVHLGTGGGIEKVKQLQKEQKLTQDTTEELKKLWRLPFAVRDAVSEELKKLVQKDIIEKMESSEWVSPEMLIDLLPSCRSCPGRSPRRLTLHQTQWSPARPLGLHRPDETHAV
uniref:Uncharacterized protein n=1 Tax=Sphaerodactylus townsendi TaxID=933632 RepID=A0ACB8FAS2_9SAUR